MTTTAKVHFQFVDDSDDNPDTNSASYNDRLVLDETDLQKKRESLLSTMASDVWKTHPKHGSMYCLPIQVHVTDLGEWSFAMIPTIELMYKDPRNNHNSNNENNNDDSVTHTITLPERGVELRDLLPVLDYLGLIKRDCISSDTVDLSQVKDVPTKKRAQRYLRILQVLQKLVKTSEKAYEKKPYSRSRLLFCQDVHDAYDIRHHNPQNMLELVKNDDAFAYANDQDFRNEVNQVFQAQGLDTEWGSSRMIVRVTGASDEKKNYGTLTHVDVIVPGPPPSKKAKSSPYGSK